jgi:tetratricopeptide (TPR) repeat protein
VPGNIYIRLLLLAAACLPLDAQSSNGLAAIEGYVRDAQNHPIAAARVLLRTDAETQTVLTGAEGDYHFAALAEGTYTLIASGNGYAETSTGRFLLGHETKKLDLTLKPNGFKPNGQPEFFDEPHFTVAGVSDPANAGGHGSEAVLRSTDALTRDTASLSKTSGATADYGQQRARAQTLLTQSDKAEFHHLLADADEKLGRFLEAVHEYQRAAEMDPSESNVFDWASELLTHGAFVPSIEVFSKGTHLFPVSKRMLLGSAVASYAHGEYDQAAHSFFAACDVDPADPEPYLFLGKVQSTEITQSTGYSERMGRFARLQPANAWANYYYAMTLWQRSNGQQDSAALVQVESLLRKAVALDPHLEVAYLQLGILYSDRKDFPAAIAAYRQALDVSSDTTEGADTAHYRLAEAYRHTGETQRAENEFALYRQLSKQTADIVRRQRAEIKQFVVDLQGQPGVQQTH